MKSLKLMQSIEQGDALIHDPLLFEQWVENHLQIMTEDWLIK